MDTVWSDRGIDYDGSQLRAGWLAETFELEPDAAAAFAGACDVAPEHMIDLEDLAANESIVARRMLHFIIEFRDGDLERMACRQRLLIVCALESLAASGAPALRREGDDLFADNGRKLSVSVATRSAAGTGLIHAGLNINPEGAPVPAAGLAELGVVRSEEDAREFALDVLRRYAAEIAGVRRATRKVREAP